MVEFFVPPGHFYSPWPDVEEAATHIQRAKSRVSVPAAINIDNSVMLDVWQELLSSMRDIPFGASKSNEYRYFFENDQFSYGDACVYFAYLNKLRPKKIIEVGSGYTSALALDTIQQLDLDTEVTFIDPYPVRLKSLLKNSDFQKITIVEDKVQNVSLDLFKTLEKNDILFIDSSHVAKTGSDVCYEIFEILPVIKKGVYVVFHDIFYQFEYPERWVVEDKRAWNEVYFLRAFLMYNERFNIEFFNHYFMVTFPELVMKSDVLFKKNCGGSLWLR